MAFVSLYNGANNPNMICGVLDARPSICFKPSISTRCSISSTTSVVRYLKLHHNFGILKVSTSISRTRKRGDSSIRFYNSGGQSDDSSDQKKVNELNWPILKRWNVPWPWQTVSLTSLACGISFVLTGLIESAAFPYLGIQIGELTMDDKAELLLVAQSITTLAVLGVLFGLTGSFKPFDDDIFRYGINLSLALLALTYSFIRDASCSLPYSLVMNKKHGIVLAIFFIHCYLFEILLDLREPFDLQKGWLLWAGVGLIGAVGAIALTGVALSYFGEPPKRETDALVTLLPLIGASPISTACLLGVTGVLAPVLEETVFRGFLMVSLTEWVPTPVAVTISAAVFALAHLTPGEFPQLFILGTALGISYAQTRNLMTSITIHAFWNSGVILFLTFLQLQGNDIREILQATQ